MLFAMLSLFFSVQCPAAESRVRGLLSTNSASVGEAVEYELMIEGGGGLENEPALKVDGLEVRFAGQNRQMSFINGDVTNRLILTYQLVPKREGKFTIPAVEVQIGGKIFKTLPATLTVAPGEKMKEAGDLAFAKIFLPKKTLYVGESVPMEVRLYLDATARWDLRAMPPQTGDGFTTRPFGKPTERNIQLEGKPYVLATFSTVITPGKAGKMAIGPVPANLVVSRRQRGRQEFEFFGPRMGPATEMTVTAEELAIEVKPLPVVGRPKDFSGAIGKFDFSATGTPERVKVGEPVSMKLVIKGSGNFDRIGQPPLDEPQDWTTYSAKENFSGNEGADTEGVKTFELPVTPTVAKATMPVFAFSYFDPETEKYVTLKSVPAPLTVEGVPVIATPPPVPATAQNPAKPKDEPKTPAVQDILANLPEIGKASAAFGPSLSPAVFFAILGAPVPLALAFVAWRRRRGDAKLARVAALRRERAGMIAQVKNAANRAEVFDAAVKAVRIAAQLENGASRDDDGAVLLGSRRLDAETEKSLREIFDARTELLYAGAARGEDRISERERDRVLEAVAAFERSPRK